MTVFPASGGVVKLGMPFPQCRMMRLRAMASRPRVGSGIGLSGGGYFERADDDKAVSEDEAVACLKWVSCW